MSWAFVERWVGQLRLEGVARGDPNATTARIDDAFGDARASITDVHFFAGVRTVLTFSATREELALLVAGLERAGVELDAPSRAAIEAALAAPPPRAEESSEQKQDFEGTLAVTFLHGDPDQKHEVPAVPG
jgi:hypothetical protein